ncbi:MAG: hypothetical protein QOE51_1102 [Actinoplanes sp.]|jgi:hypothetical protein|nr:hypothetical protein [Actinoplanes sp.]
MPEAGAIYKLAEADYRFGVGPLLVKVTKIVSEIVFDNEPWWDVEGWSNTLTTQDQRKSDGSTSEPPACGTQDTRPSEPLRSR